MEYTEDTLSKKEIFDGKVISLRVEKVKLCDGRVEDREIVAHNGGVGVIAFDDDNNVFMVRQYRLAARRSMLEIPAGKLEKGEDPFECGKRELTEETGYRAKHFEHLGEFFVSPGYCEEKINLYLARDLEFVGQHLDDGEFLNVEKYSMDELTDMVINNKINDAKTVIAILKAAIINNSNNE